MSIEESFAKAVVEIQAKYPVLQHRLDCKVMVRVGSILEIGKAFHARGWDDNDLLGDLLGLRK